MGLTKWTFVPHWSGYFPHSWRYSYNLNYQNVTTFSDWPPITNLNNDKLSRNELPPTMFINKYMSNLPLLPILLQNIQSPTEVLQGINQMDLFPHWVDFYILNWIDTYKLNHQTLMNFSEQLSFTKLKNDKLSWNTLSPMMFTRSIYVKSPSSTNTYSENPINHTSVERY